MTEPHPAPERPVYRAYSSNEHLPPPLPPPDPLPPPPQRKPSEHSEYAKPARYAPPARPFSIALMIVSLAAGFLAWHAFGIWTIMFALATMPLTWYWRFRRGHTGSFVAATISTVVLLIAGTAFLVLPRLFPSPHPPQAAPLKPGTVYATSVTVGDCLLSRDFLEDTEVDALTVVQCTQEHDAEVFALLYISGPSWDYGVLRMQAQQGCSASLTQYVSSEATRKRIKIFYIIPNQAAFDRGRRAISCIGVMDTTLTRSLRA